MTRSRSRFWMTPVIAVIALVAVLAVVLAASVAAPAGPVPAGSSAEVRDWERIAISTIYGPPDLPVRTPIPVGVHYMGFTSLAMYRAAEAADRQHGSPVAAIARAAHDVLAEYVATPTAAADLAAALALTAGQGTDHHIEIPVAKHFRR